MRKKHVKRMLALCCAAALSAGMLAGCGSEETRDSGGTDGGAPDDTSEKVTITIGIKSFTDSSTYKYWPMEVVNQIEDKLNIELQFVSYDDQKLSLDLASGDMCDIMCISPDYIDNVLKGKHAVNLDEYTDTLAENIHSERFDTRNSVMREFRSNDTQELYFTTPGGLNEGEGERYATVMYGYGVRWDLYKEIGMPQIDSGDDYIEVLKQMKEIYPETEEGLPVYAMGHYNDSGLHSWTFRGMVDLGYSNVDSNCMYLVDVRTNELVSNIMTDEEKSPFWDDMRFYNKMYKEGLLDPDCFIEKGEDLKGKYTKGQYLGGINTWHWGDWNTAHADTNEGYVLLPANMSWSGGYSAGGWSDKLFFVSRESENKERAVMTLDYFNSEEFARLVFSGIEGTNWENGELTDDTISMKSDPNRTEEWSQLGLDGSFNWGSVSAIGATAVLEDGAPASLWMTDKAFSSSLSTTEKDMSETMGVEYPAQIAEKRIEEGKSFDQSAIQNLNTACMESAPQDITRIDNNVAELVTNAIPDLVQAEDDAAFEEAKEKLLEDVKAANIETAVEWWTENYNNAKAAVAELSAE